MPGARPLQPLTARLAACVVACALMLACGGEAESPEARVRAAIAALAEAVEARDASRFKDRVAEDYSDAGGRDRRELGQLLAFYGMRNQSIHVVTRVKDVTFRAPDHAQVVVVAATAGRPIQSAADLAGIRADVYHLDLDLRERDGEWLLTFAQWRPTPATDLF